MEKIALVEVSVQKQADTKTKLAQIISDTSSLEAKALMLENIMKQEEQRNKQLDKDLKNARDLRN